MEVCWALAHFQSLYPLPIYDCALLAAALVVKPRLGGFAYVLSPSGLFKWQKSSSFFHCHKLLWVFTARGNGDLSSQHWNWAVPSGLGLGLLTPKVSLPIFIHHTWICDCPFYHCLFVPHHLSTHLHNSAPPTHLDEYGFFKSLVVGLPYSSIFWGL